MHNKSYACRYVHIMDAVRWHLSPRAPYDCNVTFTDNLSVVVRGCGNKSQLVFEGGQSGGNGVRET